MLSPIGKTAKSYILWTDAEDHWTRPSTMMLFTTSFLKPCKSSPSKHLQPRSITGYRPLNRHGHQCRRILHHLNHLHLGRRRLQTDPRPPRGIPMTHFNAILRFTFNSVMVLSGSPNQPILAVEVIVIKGLWHQLEPGLILQVNIQPCPQVPAAYLTVPAMTTRQHRTFDHPPIWFEPLWLQLSVGHPGLLQRGVCETCLSPNQQGSLRSSRARPSRPWSVLYLIICCVCYRCFCANLLIREWW